MSMRDSTKDSRTNGEIPATAEEVNDDGDIAVAEALPDDEEDSGVLRLGGVEDTGETSRPGSAQFTKEEDSFRLSDRQEDKEMRRIGSLLSTRDEPKSVTRAEKRQTRSETTRPREEKIQFPVHKDEAPGIRNEVSVEKEPTQDSGPKIFSPPKEGGEQTIIQRFQVPIAIFVVLLLLGTVFVWVNSPPEDAIEVTVPEKMINDFGQYSVWGQIISSSPDNQVERVEFNILKSSVMTIRINDYETIKDGFGLQREAYETETVQTLDLEGEVEVSAIDGSTDVEGNWLIEENSYLVHDKVVRSHIESELDLRGKSGLGAIESTADADLFPSLANVDEDKTQLDDVYREKTIKKGDSGTLVKGGIHFNWTVAKQEKIGKYECLMIEYKIDEDELIKAIDESYDVDLANAGTVDAAYLKIWVANGVSLDVKRQVYIQVHDDSSEFKLDYTIQMERYNKGNKAINEEDVDAPAKHQLAVRESWNDFPAHGDAHNSSIPADFTLQTAYDEGENSNPDFADYIQDHPEEYVVYAKYNESNDIGGWNFTFSTDKTSRRGFVMNVTRHSGTYISNDYGERLLTSVDPTLAVSKTREQQQDEMISFASAEQIFKSNDRVYDTAFNSNQDRVNFQDYSLGVRTDLAYPGIDITSLNFDVENSPYAYFIQSENGAKEDSSGGDTIFNGESFVVGVDAYTGQFLYVADVEYELSLY
jgi:hypothetical protein